MDILSLKPCRIISDSRDVDVPCQFLKHLCVVGSLDVACDFTQTEQYLFWIPKYITFFVFPPTIQSDKNNSQSTVTFINYNMCVSTDVLQVFVGVFLK